MGREKPKKGHRLVTFEPREGERYYLRRLLTHVRGPMSVEELLMVRDSIYSSKSQTFFIDGPGGTSKTFLYRALLVVLHSQRYVTTAVATSSVATSVLFDGRTVHSRFKIPLDFQHKKLVNLIKQIGVAKLIFEAKLILWDEASMAKRETIEAFNTLLKDIMESDKFYRLLVLGGDF
nr:uncharacterized protein LOC113700867 [Coffea arabica]